MRQHSRSSVVLGDASHREIGIRIALGADRSRVLPEVVGSGIRFTLVGIGLGLPLAFWAKPALEAFLYATSVIEPVAFVGVPLLFVALRHD